MIKAKLPKQEKETNKTRLIKLLDGPEFVFSPSKFVLKDKDNYKSYSIDLSWIDENSGLHHSIFLVLTNLFQTHSLSYADMAVRSFHYWNRAHSLSGEIKLADIESLAKIKHSYHAFILPTLRRLNDASLDGLSDEVAEWLRTGHRNEEQGNGQYFTLLTNDPERGALTDQELHNLHSALNIAYQQAKFDIEQYALAWMLMGTGLRPYQIARMTVDDVIINKGPEGDEVTLRIPLIKGEKSLRTEYWLRRAPTVLADCLIRYLDDSKSSDGKNGYLFLNSSTNRNIGNYIRRIFNGLETWSDRLEGPIPINAYRFRYTLATRAIRQGASDYEVARLLTHRSTSCIQFYRASMPELQKPINNAIGKEMDYFAKAFQGKLIRSLHEATYPDDGEQEILDFIHLTGQTLGACGTRAECHLNAPVACLSCHRFEPLEEAPWEELLEKLKEDQDLEKEERIRLINHNAMSSIIEIMAERDKRKENRS